MELNLAAYAMPGILLAVLCILLIAIFIGRCVLSVDDGRIHHLLSRQGGRREGSIRQPMPRKGDGEKDDIQRVGIVSDMEMTAEEMGRCKREHWSVEM